jgi:molybdate transport system ATP-binding protein
VDNTQAHAHEIYLFGNRRGSGESIWDIKQKIGIVSTEFQIRYRKRIQAWDRVAASDQLQLPEDKRID